MSFTDHLKAVIDSTDQLDVNLVSQQELMLTRSNCQSYQSAIPLIFTLLQQNSLLYDQADPLIKLLDSMLEYATPEDLVSMIGLDKFISALGSGYPPLQILATKLLPKLEPVDIIANTEILLQLVLISRDPDSPLKLVSSVESCLKTLLLTGELIRRRMTSKEFIKVYKEMADDSAVKSRLYDLLPDILLHVHPNHIPDNLYCLDMEAETSSSDVLNALLAIQFTSSLLPVANERGWLSKLVPQAEFITSALLGSPDDFLGNEMIRSICSLSRFFEPSDVFGVIDEKFKLLDHFAQSSSPSALLLFSNIHPQRVSQMDSFLESLVLRSKTIAVFQNFFSDPVTFEKLHLSTESIKSLEFSHMLEIVETATKFTHTTRALLREWPVILNAVIDNKEVYNYTLWDTKKRILENLIWKDAELLGVWQSKLFSAYKEMVNGKPLDTRVDVAIKY